MNRGGIVLLAVGTFCVFATPGRAAPPAEAFGSLPGAEYAQISPDGTHLAIVKPVNGVEKVVFVDLMKPDAKPYIVGMQGGLADEVYWKSNDRAICIFHANLDHKYNRRINSWSRAVGVALSSQTAVLLMANAPSFRANYDEGSITDIDAGDPDHVFMTEVDRWDRDYTLDLYKVDLSTGNAERVSGGDRNTVGYAMDGYGHVVAQVEQDQDLVQHLMMGANEIMKYSVKGSSEFGLAGMTKGQNREMAVERPTASGTTGLYAWTPSTQPSPLFENATYDLDSEVRDPRNSAIIGARYLDDVERTVYFDAGMQRVQDALEKTYPGQSVSVLSRDDAGDAYVFLTEGPKNPPALSLYTPSSHETKIIEEAYPELKPSDLGEVKPYPYKARDGLDIHAYLTLPPGKDPRNLPTVILPHGGPEARDSLSFDWLAQFIASRGYAVLQPNFRGSSGYGWNFVKAGDGEWAGKVQHDVQDGVAKLVADGVADPKRICIVGASYGGYMALAGATFSPDLYACAVSYAGVSDLARLLYTGTTFESESVSVWKRRVGADLDGSKLRTQSPANFADHVKIPVLLIHSDKDTTVPIEQSEIEEGALKRAGKPVTFVKLEGDDHYLEYSKTRIQLLTEIESFLAAHIGG